MPTKSTSNDTNGMAYTVQNTFFDHQIRDSVLGLGGDTVSNPQQVVDHVDGRSMSAGPQFQHGTYVPPGRSSAWNG